ncbi:tetratricopeptide repeat protein [Pontibacter sp. H249]|uniref:tetratricopeptide repeat protein n=1 Tax=Pontibacter sp. H249 TaxID=3133420 RepID=UPI0030BA64EC
MRYWIVAVGLLTAGVSACNTPTAITQKEQPAPQPALTMADVVPVKKPKTAAQKAKQQKFLKENTKRFRSKKLAGKYYVLQGQRTFNEHKLDSASHLFGRAWLMDSTNNDILWGYGKLYGEQKQYDKALFALYKALEKDKKNPQLLTDVATSHLNRFYNTSNPNDLVQSKKLLHEAVKLDPKQTGAYYKLAINSYYLKEYEQAWDYLHKSKVKTDEADKAFLTALLSKHRDPKGVYTRASVQ